MLRGFLPTLLRSRIAFFVRALDLYMDSTSNSSPPAEVPVSKEFLRRKSSFARQYPNIPVLAFDSSGDDLLAEKPSICIRACTWNIAGSLPKADLAALLGTSSTVSFPPVESAELPDVYAIGFQELSANPLAPVLETVVISERWSTELRKYLGPRGYLLIKTIRLQGLLLLLFCKKELQLFNVSTSVLRLGASGWWGNKGAIGISVSLYGTTICFVNCHLSAHDFAFEDRVRNYQQILSDLTFQGSDDVSTILEHDYCIWMGDFNFRIEGITQDKALFYVETKQWPKLLKHDQLHRAAFVSGAFSSFLEGRISFPPTYKYVVGTDDFDMRNASKIRRPSYCDRIMWRKRADGDHRVKLIEYNSCMSLSLSDHKPVYLLVAVQLRGKQDYFVAFDPIDRWFVGQPGFFRYTAVPGSFYSTWDWIGLFPVDYSSFDDYLTYVWSSGSASENLGCISGRYITKAGVFRLIYFSSVHKSGIGCSEPFPIESP